MPSAHRVSALHPFLLFGEDLLRLVLQHGRVQGVAACRFRMHAHQRNARHTLVCTHCSLALQEHTLTVLECACRCGSSDRAPRDERTSKHPASPNPCSLGKVPAPRVPCNTSGSSCALCAVRIAHIFGRNKRCHCGYDLGRELYGVRELPHVVRRLQRKRVRNRGHHRYCWRKRKPHRGRLSPGGHEIRVLH